MKDNLSELQFFGGVSDSYLEAAHAHIDKLKQEYLDVPGSEAFEPRGRRHLIMSDTQWRADEFKQTLGRVDRSGQISSPKITMLHLGMAAERKFVATIASRMQALGALSKGQGGSAGANALETFEIYGRIGTAAMYMAWGDMTDEEKLALRTKQFVESDPQTGYRIPRLNPVGATVEKFLLRLQIMPMALGNSIGAKFVDAYERVSMAEDASEAASRRASRTKGQILRSTQLRTDLVLHEVRSDANEKFGILEGIIMMPDRTGPPRINRIMRAMRDPSERNAPRRQYVNFRTHDGFVSGLRIPHGRVPAVAAAMGGSVARERSIATAQQDLDAGDRLILQGPEGPMTLRVKRNGDIAVEGRELTKHGDSLKAAGARFSPIGRYWYIIPDRLTQFITRFPFAEEGAERAATDEDEDEIADIEPLLATAHADRATWTGANAEAGERTAIFNARFRQQLHEGQVLTAEHAFRGDALTRLRDSVTPEAMRTPILASPLPDNVLAQAGKSAGSPTGYAIVVNSLIVEQDADLAYTIAHELMHIPQLQRIKPGKRDVDLLEDVAEMGAKHVVGYDRPNLPYYIDKSPTEAPHWHLKSQVLIDNKMRQTMTSTDFGRFLDKHGISKDEQRWLGLDKLVAGKGMVTVDNARKTVAENNPELVIKTPSPEYDLRVLPGGSNYKETLLTSPSVDYDAPHFGESGLIAHVRTDDRKTSDGKTGRFVMEVQSDLHQTARKTGYRASDPRVTHVHLDELKDVLHTAQRALNNAEERGSPKYIGQDVDEHMVVAAANNARLDEHRIGNTTDASSAALSIKAEMQAYGWSFKTVVDTELKHKRFYDVDDIVDMLNRYVLLKPKTKEELFSTPPAEDVERLISAQKAFDDALLAHDKATNEYYLQRAKPPIAPFASTWHEVAIKAALRQAAEDGMDYLLLPATGEQVAEVEGWDEPRPFATKFYTQILPSFLNSYCKPWGTQIVQVQAPVSDWTRQVYGGEEYDLASLRAIRDAAKAQNYPDPWSEATRLQLSSVIKAMEDAMENRDADQSFRRAIESYGSPALAHILGGEMETFVARETFNALPITPALRHSVLRMSQPLFTKPSEGRKPISVSLGAFGGAALSDLVESAQDRIGAVVSNATETVKDKYKQKTTFARGGRLRHVYEINEPAANALNAMYASRESGLYYAHHVSRQVLNGLNQAEKDLMMDFLKDRRAAEFEERGVRYNEDALPRLTPEKQAAIRNNPKIRAALLLHKNGPQQHILDLRLFVTPRMNIVQPPGGYFMSLVAEKDAAGNDVETGKGLEGHGSSALSRQKIKRSRFAQEATGRAKQYSHDYEHCLKVFMQDITAKANKKFALKVFLAQRDGLPLPTETVINKDGEEEEKPVRMRREADGKIHGYGKLCYTDSGGRKTLPDVIHYGGKTYEPGGEDSWGQVEFPYGYKPKQRQAMYPLLDEEGEPIPGTRSNNPVLDENGKQVYEDVYDEFGDIVLVPMMMKFRMPMPIKKAYDDATLGDSDLGSGIKTNDQKHKNAFTWHGFQSFSTMLQLSTPTELLRHSWRVLSVVSRTPNVGDGVYRLISNLPGYGIASPCKLSGLMRMWNLDMSDQENIDALQRLMDCNAGSSRAFGEYLTQNIPGLKQMSHFSHDFLFGIPDGKGLKGFDLRARVLMEKMRYAVEGTDDPRRVREFANQIGQYTSKPDVAIEMLRYINPFSATSGPMRITEIRQMIGDAGFGGGAGGGGGVNGPGPNDFDAMDPKQRAVLRMETAWRKWMAPIGTFCLLTYLAHKYHDGVGKWPWEQDSGKHWSLYVGKDKDGKAIYLDPNLQEPDAMRPARDLGAKDVIETIADARRRRVPVQGKDVAQDILRSTGNAALETVSSPAEQFILTATGGRGLFETKGNDMIRTAQSAGKGGNQALNNVSAAFENINPIATFVTKTGYGLITDTSRTANNLVGGRWLRSDNNYQGDIYTPFWRWVQNAEILLGNAVQKDKPKSKGKGSLASVPGVRMPHLTTK